MDVVIIDSGIGGMCLLPYFFKCLPFKKYLYFADVKNLPYGLKSSKELLKITIDNVKTIIKKYKPKIIVFGCNTIGTTIFDSVKEFFPNQIFFTIKPNTNSSFLSKEKTLILATSKTINSIKKCKLSSNNIILCKMPKLANKVENNLQNLNNIVPYLKQRLSKYKNIRRIVLGCTHYYFVKKQIQILFKNTKIDDGIESLTNQILYFLKDKNLKLKSKHKTKVTLFVSKKTHQKRIYKSIIKKFIKNQKSFKKIS